MRFAYLVALCAIAAFLAPIGLGEFVPGVMKTLCPPGGDCGPIPLDQYLIRAIGCCAIFAFPVVWLYGTWRNIRLAEIAKGLHLEVTGYRWNHIHTEDVRCPPALTRAYWGNVLFTWGGLAACFAIMFATGNYLKP